MGWHSFGLGPVGDWPLLDAAECATTLGMPPDLVAVPLAGGNREFESTDEGAEDDREGAGLDAAGPGPATQWWG